MSFRKQLVKLLDTWGKGSLAALALALVFWLALTTLFAGTFAAIEEISGDWIWRISASEAREQRIILIDIDEPSLRELGNWPWSRKRMAELSDRLANEGAALQVFDVVFPEGATGTEEFVARLVANQAVVAQIFALEPNTQAASGKPAGALSWPACPHALPTSLGYIANHPAFAHLPMGHITPLVEKDGVLRHQPAIICDQEKAYPALFVSALRQAQGGPDITLAPGRGLFGPAWQLKGVAFSREGIPLDAAGNVRIPWGQANRAFVSLSAADVLAGRVPRGLLNNAWVLIGSTALGLNDRIATPFGGSGAGLSVHAQLLSAALDQRIPATPRLMAVYQLLLALLGGAALVALSRRVGRSPLTLTASAAGLALVLALLKYGALTHFAIWFEWVRVALFLLLVALSLGMVEFFRSRFERDRLYAHLASYLPGQVAAALVRQDPSDAIDARRCNITALYADIRNFGAYCETRPPEAATAVLHAFFSMTTRIVEEHGGQIESFQGDAVLAVWGSSQNDPAAVHALDAALAILQASYALLPLPQDDDLAPLALGIGLETGLATVGSFGLARRRTHLAIGHPVTTATCLQGMTAELAHPILVGEGMAALVGQHRLHSQGVFLLDGLKSPCHIYAYPLKNCVEN